MAGTYLVYNYSNLSEAGATRRINKNGSNSYARPKSHLAGHRGRKLSNGISHKIAG